MKHNLTEELIHAMAAISVQKVHNALGEDASKFKSDLVAEGRDVSGILMTAKQIEACVE